MAREEKYRDPVAETAARMLEGAGELRPADGAPPEDTSPSWLRDIFDKAYIEAWVLALVFGTVEEARAGRIGYAVLCGLSSAALQILVARWGRVKERFPDIAERLHLIATDPRWWIGTLMFFLAYLAISPFVEQQRWPFLWQMTKPATPSAPVVIQAPTPEDIAKAVGPIQSQLDAANRRVRQLEQAIRNAPPPAAPNYDEPRVYTTKTLAEIRAFYEGRTPAQGDVFMADEAGKWIKVEGTIQNVLSGQVLLTTKDTRGLNCFFDQSWRAKLIVLQANEKISVTGKLRGVGQSQYMITLDECDLDD